MKKTLLFFLIIAQSILLFSQGPDNFGYTYLTSNDSLGPSYQWFDITRIGAPIQNLGDDNFSRAFPISSFKFYASQPQNMYVGSNGYIAFNPNNIASTPSGFPPIPSMNKPHGFIAPLLCDLTFAGNNNPANVYYYDRGDTICISYLKVPFWLSNAQGYGGENSFQVILNKADNSITFNYKAQSGSPHPTYNQNAVSIGIENNSGTDGLQYYRGTVSPSQYLTVKYYYPSNPKPITDAKLNWINNSANGGEFVEVNDTITPTVNIRNVGNTSIDSSFTISYEYKDSLNNRLHSGSITLDSLAAGNDSTKNLSPFSPPFPGRFTVSASISGIAKDSIPSNDQKDNLIVGLDTFRYMRSLSYASKTSPSGGISWIGGNAGVGVYIEPPYYPAKIDVVNFYIRNFGQANGFKWNLYDDQGRGSLVGNLLDSGSVSVSQLQQNSYYSDTLKQKNIIIKSGGIFLSWIMDGDGIWLGTTRPFNTPTSRRTYEVINGYWAPYRNIETEDFMMHIDISDPSIPDLALNWLNNSENKGSFIEVNDTIRPKVNIKNVGYATVDDSFRIDYSYKDSSGAVLQSGSIRLDSLPASADSTKQLPSFTPNFSGRFSISAKINGIPKDANPKNDSKEVLVVALDSLRIKQSLNYAPSNANGSVSWTYKNSGLAVYLKPPYYPAQIDFVNFYIKNLGQARDFSWKLYDDSGPGNTSGNILASDTVSVSQVSPNSYYSESIKNRNIIIDSGGVYLNWIMDGDGISLGTSRNKPSSKRTYQVFRGLWYPYENKNKEDLMMHIDISDPSLTDLSLNWINNPESAGLFIENNQNFRPTVNVKNTGRANINKSFGITYEYRDSSKAILQSGRINLNGLNQGTDSTIKLPLFNSQKPGKFSITAGVDSLPKEINLENNYKEALIVLIDSLRNLQPLNFASSNSPSTSVSWIPKNSGFAVYLKPPYYPAKIDIVNFYIQSFGQASNFKWFLYDDSGANNSHGKVLDSNTVNLNQLMPKEYYSDTISNKNIVIDSGGVYLTWMMDGDGIRLGAKLNNPTSRRTYEILRGSWAKYRSSATEDFMMHLNISSPSITGLETRLSNKSNFKLYPNPSKYSSEIIFDKKEFNKLDLKVYDLNGKRYFPKIKETENGLRLYKGKLSTGVYIIKIGDFRQKLIFTD